MRRLLTLVAVVLLAGAVEGAAARTLDKATTFELPVKLSYQALAQNLNAVRLDCKVFENGKRVGRGTGWWRLDPAYLNRRGEIDGTLPVILVEGTETETPKTCSCEARFDTRSIFFRSGQSDFGQLPWMLGRRIALAEQSCRPGATAAKDEAPSHG